MQTKQHMTDEQIKEAQGLEAEGKGWREMGRIMGMSPWAIRRILYPEWAAYRNMNQAQKRKRFRETGIIEKDAPRLTAEWVTRLDIPPDVLADRERRSWLVPETISQMLLGDPLPGCSALDQRKLENV